MVRLTVSMTLLGLACAQSPTIVHQFSAPTWLENLALYPDASAVLAAQFYPTSNLWQVPYDGSEPTLLYNFAPESSILGITESPKASSKYYVISGNYSFTTGPQAGSYSVNLVHFTGNKNKVNVKQVVNIPEAGLLNGMAALDSTNSLLLTDSVNGYIWEVKPSSGKYSIFLDAPELKRTATDLGANGLKVYTSGDKTYVYFTNSGQTLVCRVLLDAKSKPTNPIEVLHNGTRFDDFAVDAAGNAYLAGGPLNVIDHLVQVQPNQWELSTFAGEKNETILAGATSLVLDQTSNTLYVATNGGYQEPVNGVLVGGEIVKIKL